MTLVFPDEGIGRLYSYFYPFAPMKDVAEAKGKVKVMTKIPLSLRPNEFAIAHPEKIICPALSNISDLGFSKVSLNESWLDNLKLFRNYKNIKGLRFEGAKISDSGIPKLTMLPYTEILSLARTRITGTNLSLLKVLPLKFFAVSKNNLAPEAFKEIAKLKTLKELLADDLTFDWLLSSKSLAEMDAKLAPALAPLAALTKLESISVAGLPVGDKSLSFLSSLKNLTSLRAERTDIGPGTIALLKDNQLKFLNLANCSSIDDRALAEISKHQTLITIKISWDQKISAKGLNALAKLNQLQHLDMKNVAMQNSDFLFLKHMPSLWYLVLDGTGISDDAFKNLSGLKELRHLQIVGTNLSDKSVPLITRFKKLSDLHIGDCKISDAGINQIQKALPSCHIIRE